MLCLDYAKQAKLMSVTGRPLHILAEYYHGALCSDLDLLLQDVPKLKAHRQSISFFGLWFAADQAGLHCIVPCHYSLRALRFPFPKHQ